jgi:serine O-acetyltransferase
MHDKELKNRINADLRRLSKSNSILSYIKFLITNPSFKITFWFRIGSYLKKKNTLLFRILYIIVSVIHKHNQYLTGIQLRFGTQIGKGLFFAHFSGIVISRKAIIGDYCTIFHGVTIGSIRGKGEPVIGNNVVIAPGAKIIGKVKIGNNVFIGANSVVVKDIPDNAVVVGIPARILNMEGYKNTQLYVDD